MNRHDAERLLLRLRVHCWLLAAIWTGCIGGSLLWNLCQQATHSLDVARRTAQVTFENDILYRRWVANQGGVYVRVSDDTPPNPHLDVRDRDVTTNSGARLTLVNPAYMARLANAMAGAIGGSRGHLTSLKPLRPENAPDLWETAALGRFEQGEDEVSSLEETADGEHLRLMRPFLIEPSCLKCHAAQGYKLGDVRGGVSVSVPMAPLRAIERSLSVRLIAAHLGLWVVGLAGMSGFWWWNRREILARKRAEADREKFVSLADQSTEFIGMCDMHYRPFYVNEAGMRLVGLDSLQQACGTPVQEFFFPEDQRFVREELFPRVLREGRAEVEIRFRHLKTGEPAWMLCTVFCLRDAEGQCAGLATVSRNITQRKREEELLRESEERLRFALETSHTGAWELDLVDRTYFRSVEHVRIFGSDKLVLQWTYEMFLDHVLPEDRAAVDAHFRRAMETGDDCSFECRIRRGDDAVRWIWTAGRHSGSASGKTSRMAGIVQDITERKLAEERIQRHVDDLTRFNRAMIGREVRMIELKQEVNALCVALGRTAPYPIPDEKEQSSP